jgi:undecaprenyl-diphosphatase
MAVLSAIGGGWSLFAIMPLLLLRRQTRRLGRSLAIVIATTGILVFFLKRAVMRARPCNCLTDVRALLVRTPTDFSFPSGHAAGSFAFAVFLALFLVKTMPSGVTAREKLLRYVGAALLLLSAVGVGLSRIALAVHFPGDVLAGATLGTAVATLGALLHFRDGTVIDGRRPEGQVNEGRDEAPLAADAISDT